MDLVNAAVGLKQAQNTSQVQMAVARKMMDMQKMEGASVIKLINAAQQGVMQKGDALVAAATGLGSQLDTLA